MSETLLSGEKYLQAVLDALPSPVFIVDPGLTVLDANQAASSLVGCSPDLIVRRLCGDSLHCLNALRSEGGCGTTEFCRDCVIRQSVEAAAQGGKVFRRTAPMKLEENGTVREVWFQVTAAAFDYGRRGLILITLEEITELVELRRLLPMCAHCRKIRDEKDFWHDVESYLQKYTRIEFTHGLCPTCAREFYPEIVEKLFKNGETLSPQESAPADSASKE